MLNAQLPHVRVARRLDPRRMRHLQGRTNLLKESNAEVHALLLGGGQAIPPLTELIGELDFPGHALSMSCAALCRQGYIRAALWGANQLAFGFGWAVWIYLREYLRLRPVTSTSCGSAATSAA